CAPPRPRDTRLYPTRQELRGGGGGGGDRPPAKAPPEPLAKSGVIVAAPDWRQPPAAPYPASFQDIHYGIRWLKARATELGSRPDMIGSMGNSSGGAPARGGPRRAPAPRPRGPHDRGGEPRRPR